MTARITPRWRKLLNDILVSRGRFALLLIAMLLSIATVTALLAADAIVRRELPRSFAATNPAAAILRMDETDAAAVNAARQWPGVLAADAAGSMSIKVWTKTGEWLPLLITVLENYDSMRIDTFTLLSGAGRPPKGTILIERSGLNLLGAQAGVKEGDKIVVESATGARRTLAISGFVHDQSKPPSNQEVAIYGYTTPETMNLIDPTERVDQLKLLVNKARSDANSIESIARSLAILLRNEGYVVRRIDIPTGQHPHQWQYDSISRLLLSFAVFGLFLESILLAILVSGLLATQIRQVAVMKAIGASTNQILAMYLALVAALAGSAVVIGVPIGIVLGRALADFIATIVNVAIESYAIHWWIIPASIALGLFMPFLAAWVPIKGASRRTVRECIDDHGVAKSNVERRGLYALFSRLRWNETVTHLALRNTLRRRFRLLLTVALLTIAGCVFLVAGNLLAVWENVAASASNQRRFDMEVGLRAPYERASLIALASSDGVASVEAVDTLTAFLDRGDAIAVAGAGRTYMTLRFTSPDTRHVEFPLADGRWLEMTDSDSIVLNSVARNSLFPDLAVGDSVALVANGRAITVRVVGIILEQLSPAAAYATHSLYDRLADAPGQSHAVRIALGANHSIDEVSKQFKADLGRVGASVRYIATSESARRSEEAHVYVLIALLGLIVAGVATVGAVGLASAMGTAVVERTREFGIMRAVGARSSRIYMIVMTEALFAASISWLLALIASIPLSIFVVGLIRRSAVLPMTFEWSQAAAIAWLIIALATAAIASLLPARRAADLTISEALAQV